ncbi:MAG: proton-conducting transporter membrane subunit [Thermaerobacter sp.]|nr:proton-conducting transporter membrane subunit [Thermaerobacter sp.]
MTMPTTTGFGLWWPLLIPVGASFLVGVFGLRLQAWARALFTAGTLLSFGLMPFGAAARAHPLAMWGYALVAVLSLLAVWFSGPYIAAERRSHGWDARRVQRYQVFLYLFVASMMAMAIVPNYLLMWLALEGATFSSTWLVDTAHVRTSTEAAWKYMVLTESAGLAGLAGTVLIIHFTGHNVAHWGFHFAQAGSVWPSGVVLGVLLAAIGYGTKAGLAPFHTWLPDAHSEAPAPVSALLSSLKLAGSLMILERLLVIAGGAIAHAITSDILMGLGLVSLLIAAGFVASQQDLKRLWAYSSIEHIGLIALGFGFGGIALLGALLHMWTHALNKSLLFYNAGTVRVLYHTSRHAEGARGILGRTPWTGMLLSVGSLGIVGVPPFAPFWSEWLILAGGFQNPADRPLVWIAMALLVVIFIGIALMVPRWLFVAGRVQAEPVSGTRLAEPWSLLWPSAVLLVMVSVGGLAIPLVAHGWWVNAGQRLGHFGP